MPNTKTTKAAAKPAQQTDLNNIALKLKGVDINGVKIEELSLEAKFKPASDENQSKMIEVVQAIYSALATRL